MQTRDLRLVVVDRLELLAQYAQAWNGLAERAPQQLPMSSYAWVATYLEKTIAGTAPWRCVFALQADTLVGVLAVVAVRRAKFAGIPFTILRTPRDDHTQIGDILVDASAGSGVAVALLEAAAGSMGGVSCIEINRFASTSPLAAWLEGRKLPLLHTWKQDSYGAYLPIPADYTAFRQGLSKNFKSNLNKATNKVAGLADVTYRFETGAHAAVEELAGFIQIEASGWKGQQGSAIAGSQQLIGFYETLVKHLRAAGWLEWHFMHGDGLLLAGNLSIRMPRAVIVWKLGYNDAYSRCSPGSILMEKLIERECAARTLAEINLTTDLPWYDNWQMQRRLYYTARFYFGWRGALAWFPDAMKSVLRQSKLVQRLRARLQKAPQES